MTIFRLYKEMSIKISNWNIAVLLYSKENQLYILVSSVQSLTRVWLWSMVSSKPGFPVHQQLPELPQTHVHRVTDAMQPSSSVVPFSHLQFFPSSGSFSVSLFFASGGQSIGSSASACPSNEYWGLISFRMEWCDLAVQGTLKSLLQHHSSKTSILWHSAFFIVQLSHP